MNKFSFLLKVALATVKVALATFACLLFFGGCALGPYYPDRHGHERRYDHDLRRGYSPHTHPDRVHSHRHRGWHNHERGGRRRDGGRRRGGRRR